MRLPPATHQVPGDPKWLVAHPRFHMHYTPTYSSWINQVERWFAYLTATCSTAATTAASKPSKDIRAWITAWNENHETVHVDQDRRTNPRLARTTSISESTARDTRWLVFFAWRWPAGLTGSGGCARGCCLPREWSMTLGLAPKQGSLFRSTVGDCEDRVPPDSIYGVLHRERFNLFPDDVRQPVHRCGSLLGAADGRGGGDGAAADRGA